MMAQTLFKEQLLEFVEDREEPFTEEYLEENCNDKFIDRSWIRDALCNLEEEGRIVRLDHHYLSTRVLMKRWTRHQEKAPLEKALTIPQSLLRTIQDLLEARPNLGYIDADEFIRDAIRRFIQYYQAK